MHRITGAKISTDRWCRNQDFRTDNELVFSDEIRPGTSDTQSSTYATARLPHLHQLTDQHLALIGAGLVFCTLVHRAVHEDRAHIERRLYSQ
jgi:hypothetical protein